MCLLADAYEVADSIEKDVLAAVSPLKKNRMNRLIDYSKPQHSIENFLGASGFCVVSINFQ